MKAILNDGHDGPPDSAWKAIERMQLEISSQTAAEGSGHQIPGTGLTTYHRILDDGHIVHSSSRALGPALDRAHHLESEVAVYPRVVVDDAVRMLVDTDRGIELPSWIGKPVQGIRDSLVERRTQHAGSPKILSKDNWMIAYFNDVVREIPQLASLEIG